MIDLVPVSAALVAGLFGSIHCATMCGPLVASGASTRSDALGYFTARSAGYAAVGALLGALGHHAMCILPMRAFEIGAALLVAIALGVRGLQVLRPPPPKGLVRLGVRPKLEVASLLASVLPRRGAPLGLATAILPCGLLLPVWALAAGSADPRVGALVMLVFSLVTAPALGVAALGGRAVGKLFARLPRAAIATGWALLAVMTALRPLWVAAHCAH